MDMNYSQLVKDTSVYPKTVENFDLAYLTLGLFDEMAELFEKIDNNSPIIELKKEAGDVCWYACGICNILNIDFMKLINNLKGKNANCNPFPLLGMVKKFYRDEKEIDIIIIEKLLSDILSNILGGLDATEVLEINYNKLISRKENNTIKGDGDNR